MRSPLGGVVEDEHLGPGISVRMVAGDPRCTGAGASALAAENQQLKQEVEALKQLLGDVGSCGPGGAGSVRRHLAQLAQLQRQVGRLQAELLSRNTIVQEADTILHEAAVKLSDAASSSSAAGGDVGAWSQRMLQRLGRARAQAAATLRCGSADADAGGGSWQSEDGAAGDQLRHTQLPWYPVGGNRLLPPHAALTTVQLCDGQGVLMADAARVADLEQQLVALGPHLAALAVALKAQVLPAMPWLDAQLPCECAELAESVGAAASQLLELGCLVGQQCMLRPGAQAAAAASVSRQAAAAATAGQWGHQEASAPAQAPGQLPTVAQEALSQLSSCIEAAVAEAREAGCSKRPQPGGASSIGRTSGGGGGGGTAPAQQHVAAVLHQLAASQRLLRQLGLHCRMAAAKQALLHEQLQFAATATAAQARLAGGLVNEVAGAIQSCTDTEAADELRQRELRAAVAHLLKGMQLMERHPGQPALLALLDVLDKHRDVLAALPEALERASAPAVQAAALTAVQAAFKRYSDRLHEGQQRTHQVARRLKESVLGMQEQLQSGHGGGAAVARGAAAPPSSWALHTNTGTCPLLARE